MLNRSRALAPLLRHSWRAIDLRAFAVAAVLSLLILSIPAITAVELQVDDLTTLIRLSTLLGALGAAFTLDDPAASTTATAATTRLWRQAIRVLVMTPLILCWWATALWVIQLNAAEDVRMQLPERELWLEMITAMAVAFALAAVAARFTGDSSAGIVAAPAVLVCALLVLFLPARMDLFAAPGQGLANEAYAWWWGLFVSAVVVFGAAGSGGRHSLPTSREGHPR